MSGSVARPGWSRRSFIQASAALAAAGAVAPALASCTTDPATAATTTGPPGPSTGVFAELDAKITAGMTAHAVPGVAVAVWYQGKEYLKGYGVTSLADPQPVTADTAFRIASTTKTFTGTAMMRLVEAGKVNLDATVRTYLPTFATSDPAVAQKVTVRQLLNHTAGWLGEYLQDFGRGDDALAQFTAGVARLPQRQRPGARRSTRTPGWPWPAAWSR